MTGGPTSFSLSYSHVQQSVATTITSDANYIYVDNSYVKYTFTKTLGWLYSLVDKQTGFDFVTTKTAAQVPFQFWTDYGGYFNSAYLINGDRTQSFSYSTQQLANGAELDMQWSGFNVGGRNFAITVSASITLYDNSSFSHWRIKLANHDSVAITFIGFPFIDLGQMSTNPINDCLSFPAVTGELYQDPLHNLVHGLGYMYLYPGGQQNMQFLSYYSREIGAGVYVATYDTAGYSKFLNIGVADNRQWFWVDPVFIPSFVKGVDASPPYDIVVGVFHGDWYTASQIYRNWALEQWWTSQGPTRTRNDVPEWLKKTSVLADVYTRYWERNSPNWDGPFSNVPLIAQSMKSTFGSSPLLFWRGWEADGWLLTTGPNIFPPTEGWSSFDSAVSLTHQNGGHIQVIETTNQYVVGTPGWDTAQAHATVDQNGNYYTLTNTGLIDNSGKVVTTVFAMMDPDSYWQSVLSSMTLTLAEHGVDMLQLDGNPVQPYLDFSTSHSNPLGGGNWWFKGYQNIFSTLRSEAKAINPNFVFGAETCVELYIPYIDACADPTSVGFNPLNIDDAGVYNAALVSFIPMWQSVYHDYILTYAFFNLIAKTEAADAPFYQRALGLGLTFGGNVEVDMDPRGTGLPYDMTQYNPTLLTYVTSISNTRLSNAYPYVVQGQMLAPLIISAPQITIPATTFRLPGSGELVPSFQTASVVGSAWMASDGTISLLLTNIASQQETATVSLSNILGASSTPLTITLQPLQVYFAIAPNTIRFASTPGIFLGSQSGSISACGDTFKNGESAAWFNGQAAVCASSFSATANLPSPSSGWKFDHWEWSGGISCANPSSNPVSCSLSGNTGSLRAVYAAQVSFAVSPLVAGNLIGWSSCAGPNEPNEASVYFTNYGSVTACYVPSGYTLSSWSCSGGLACSGSNNPTSVMFTGPGTITLNFKTGSLTSPVSTSLTASAKPSSTHGGTTFTVSGSLTTNGVGVGGKTIVLVFGWNENIVTVTTALNGLYTYTATAPASPGQYKVEAFFLGDYGGSTQYLPSTATATITVT